MPDLEVQSEQMGAWGFDLDEDGKVQGLSVSIYLEASYGGQLVTGGRDFDAWPLLTQGQRQQLQLIVDKVLTVVEGA